LCGEDRGVDWGRLTVDGEVEGGWLMEEEGLMVDGGRLMENSQKSPLERRFRDVYFFWLMEDGGWLMENSHEGLTEDG